MGKSLPIKTPRFQDLLKSFLYSILSSINWKQYSCKLVIIYWIYSGCACFNINKPRHHSIAIKGNVASLYHTPCLSSVFKMRWCHILMSNIWRLLGGEKWESGVFILCKNDNWKNNNGVKIKVNRPSLSTHRRRCEAPPTAPAQLHWRHEILSHLLPHCRKAIRLNNGRLRNQNPFI